MGSDTGSENWRHVPTWEGFYEVSDIGRVRSVQRTVIAGGQKPGARVFQSRVLRPTYTTGYAVVQLVDTSQGRREQRYVHDLVLSAFVGPKPDGLEVCHGRAGQHVNTLMNLRYDTRSANAQDRVLFGKKHPPQPRKPPLETVCFICGTAIRITKHRTRKRFLCSSKDCLSECGRRSMKEVK